MLKFFLNIKIVTKRNEVVLLRGFSMPLTSS